MVAPLSDIARERSTQGSQDHGRTSCSTSHHAHRRNITEATVAQATTKNQKTIMANQKTITKNQDKILRNQATMMKNQKKLLAGLARLLKR